jgi:hypothetical protein
MWDENTDTATDNLLANLGDFTVPGMHKPSQDVGDIYKVSEPTGGDISTVEKSLVGRFHIVAFGAIRQPDIRRAVLSSTDGCRNQAAIFPGFSRAESPVKKPKIHPSQYGTDRESRAIESGES